MTRDQLQACTKKALANMARERGIAGWHGMRKDELILALEHKARAAALEKAARARRDRKAPATGVPANPPAPRLPLRAPVQIAAARNTSGEEQVESSKYDVGVPTRDLSAKVPRDLPAGYGKDRATADRRSAAEVVAQCPPVRGRACLG